jgi:hypothetical protein
LQREDDKARIEILNRIHTGIEQGKATVENLIGFLEWVGSWRWENPMPLLKFLCDDQPSGWPRGAFAPLAIPWLQDPTEEIKLIAIEVLHGSGESHLGRPLVPLLQDESPKVREAVVKAIRNLEAKEFVEDILPLLHDPSEKVRDQAVLAIGRFGSPEHRKSLWPLTKDQSWDVRASVVTSLAHDAPPEFYDILLGMCQDRSVWVRHRLAVPLWVDRPSEWHGRVRLQLEKLEQDSNKQVRYEAQVKLLFLRDREPMDLMYSSAMKILTPPFSGGGNVIIFQRLSGFHSPKWSR